MELFGKVNIDWLRMKWYFLAFSMIFSVLGIISMCVHWAQIGSPVPLGVDFKGGTQVLVKFEQTAGYQPDSSGCIRGGHQGRLVQPIRDFNEAGGNEMLISLPEQQDESALDQGRKQIVDALQANYANPVHGAERGRGGADGGQAVGEQGRAGHALLDGRDAGLPLVPLPVDLWRGGGGGLLP